MAHTEASFSQLPPSGLLRQAALFLATIKFSHTLFSLPFALSAVVLAWPQARHRSWVDVVWVVLAVVFARTFAMGVNRLADRQIDRTNPRTADRPLARGALSPAVAWGLTLASLGGFFVMSGLLGRTCLVLSPVAALALGGYSFFKRFSWTCHFWLGLCLALAPGGAWVAITGAVRGAPLWMMLGVLCWVAGFDLIYATQDIEHDRREKLHSFPARFGEKPAEWTALMLHALAVGALWMQGQGALLHRPGYWAGWGVFSAVLALTRVWGFYRPAFRGGTVFMNLNALASVVYFAGILAAR